MAESRKKDTGRRSSAVAKPRSVAIANEGVYTGEDFAHLMSALMSDVIEGRVTPDIANAACNAGGKLLKVVEMQYRYGGEQASQRQPFALVARSA